MILRFTTSLTSLLEQMVIYLIATIVKAPDFRKAVNENFLSTRDGGNKEFAWDFAYQLANSFDHGNDLLHFNMSERM
ncbi:hypothetical protein RclHR1_00650036 [Rhizophagus clarus]|uniref:Uncharacterized protein n=1 Tax=Rhizophagus clarus TaxID=94130 RepID=A0A2Z6SIR4_9GLOM|nr:hypothetical protein RclHR1_00650036 [Rhizophagus clarus]